MIKKVLLGCLFVALAASAWLKFGPKNLYDGYTYNVKPQAEFITKLLQEKYGSKYKFYTANFNKDDEIPDIGEYNPNAILWLGRRQLNYQRGDIKNIKKYGIVLHSEFNHAFALKLLGAKRIYQFPEFITSYTPPSIYGEYYALIGHPKYAESVLKEHKLSYKRYTFAEIKKLRKDLPKIKGIIIEQSNQKYNMDTVLLEAIAAGIIVSENRVDMISSSQALVGEIVEYYFDKGELADIIEKTEQNKNREKKAFNKNWILKFFSSEAAEKRLLSVLNDEEYRELSDNWVNIYIRNQVGFHPAGDTWLAKDMISKFSKDYNYYLMFEDTTYRPRSSIQLLLVGRIEGIEFENTSDNGILWIAFPHVSKSSAMKSFEEYMEDVSKLSVHFKRIAVSSRKMQEYLLNKGIKAEWIPQFTNTDRFYPDYDEDKKSEILFVGNNHFERQIVNLSKKHNLPITIYGKWWPKGWAKADYVDNRILRKYYSSAKIVLSDQNKYMTDFGVIVNRIFDATAAGALVVSEYVPAVEEVYGDCVPMWKTEEEFVNLVNYYLTHDEKREEKAKCAREITLKNFTSEAVAKKFNQIIEELKEKSIQNEKNILQFIKR